MDNDRGLLRPRFFIKDRLLSLTKKELGGMYSKPLEPAYNLMSRKKEEISAEKDIFQRGILTYDEKKKILFS